MAQHDVTTSDILAEVEAARDRLMDEARPTAMAKLEARGKLSESRSLPNDLLACPKESRANSNP